ncbi:hypothetical protein J6590_045697 [Homalodisca vitripennis]|nr:hypothetical protein J6590_045697 [Homalodisca vitripennis]
MIFGYSFCKVQVITVTPIVVTGIYPNRYPGFITQRRCACKDFHHRPGWDGARAVPPEVPGHSEKIREKQYDYGPDLKSQVWCRLSD